jgi:hypothetical protein
VTTRLVVSPPTQLAKLANTAVVPRGWRDGRWLLTSYHIVGNIFMQLSALVPSHRHMWRSQPCRYLPGSLCYYLVRVFGPRHAASLQQAQQAQRANKYPAAQARSQNDPGHRTVSCCISQRRRGSYISDVTAQPKANSLPPDESSLISGKLRHHRHPIGTPSAPYRPILSSSPTSGPLSTNFYEAQLDNLTQATIHFWLICAHL